MRKETLFPRGSGFIFRYGPYVIFGTFIIYSLVFSRITFSIAGSIAGDTILVFPLALFFQGLFLIASRNSTFSQIIGYIEE